MDDAAGRIDRYLNEVCWALDGSLAEAQAVRDELRAHILDAAQEAELAGAPHADAVTAALAALGDPATLGRAMRSSRGTAPLRRPLTQPDGALAFGARHHGALPRRALLVALAAAGVMSALVSLLYAWPG